MKILSEYQDGVNYHLYQEGDNYYIKADGRIVDRFTTSNKEQAISRFYTIMTAML